MLYSVVINIYIGNLVWGSPVYGIASGRILGRVCCSKDQASNPCRTKMASIIIEVTVTLESRIS